MNTMILLFGLNVAPLLDAISRVESESGVTSDNIFQISQIYYNDVLRIRDITHCCYPTLSYPILAKNRLASENAILDYWRFYGQHYLQANPTAIMTLEVLARIHNGGPDGWRKSATVEYWNRVKKELQNLGAI